MTDLATPRRLALAMLALLAATPALAGPQAARLARVDARQARQDVRIDAGIANGSINRREAARLDAQQARLDRTESRLLADGRFSRADAVRLDRRQDAASRNIARSRYNRR